MDKNNDTNHNFNGKVAFVKLYDISFYTIYTAPLPTLTAEGVSQYSYHRFLAMPCGVDTNFEKIKNVITQVKIKLMTSNLVWGSFIPI